jgi:hypothetical protein
LVVNRFHKNFYFKITIPKEHSKNYSWKRLLSIIINRKRALPHLLFVDKKEKFMICKKVFKSLISGCEAVFMFRRRQFFILPESLRKHHNINELLLLKFGFVQH